MLKGISDTNTEEQILRSIDVLKEVVLSSRKETNQRFERVESDIKDIRVEMKAFRTDTNQRFERVESDIKGIRTEMKAFRTDV
ncbi:MAG: hypothetical protein OXI89_01050, partial [Gemmatimonadota bacterium]|nr:hypothetical protein [Gemmatimonadota bacterium]